MNNGALTGRASIRDKANIFGRLLADAISKSVAQAGAQTFEESVSSAKETAENLIQAQLMKILKNQKHLFL